MGWFLTWTSRTADSSDTASSSPDAHANTTRRIAIWLLVAFICSIALLLVINGYVLWVVEHRPAADTNLGDADLRKSWFEVLKTSIFLLGTALTTVIGYYFGQRAGEQAVAAGEKAVAAERKENEAKSIVQESVIRNVEHEKADAIRQSAQSAKPSDPKNVAGETSVQADDLDIQAP